MSHNRNRRNFSSNPSNSNYLTRNDRINSGEDDNGHQDVVDDSDAAWNIPHHHQHYSKRVPSSLGSTTLPSITSSTSNASKLNSLDCWDYTIELECLQGPQDLQLAAELGKTLLERNKELENSLKHQQNIIDDQAQEIVYLQKQTAALREVNDSRLKIYEQLEVGIQDLERANHRLLVENTADKKHIKSLLHNIENLESRTDELTRSLEDVRKSLLTERRKNERLQEEKNSLGNELSAPLRRVPQNCNKTDETSIQEDGGFEAQTTAPENFSFAFQTPKGSRNANSTGISLENNELFDVSNLSMEEDNEEIVHHLVSDLETTRKALTAEKQRADELEEQIVAMIQENQNLQGRIAQNSSNEEMKSVHEELSILDEVRQGNMCSRCLRSVDENGPALIDDASSIAPTEDDDLSCIMEDGTASITNRQSFQPTVPIKVSLKGHPDSIDLQAPPSPNPYRDLVEKYEALLEVQRHSNARKSIVGMSLAEEFQSSGEFSKLGVQKSGNDCSSSCNGSTTNENQGSNKMSRRTPTEFSEAETSSSGFSDETSTKATQTEDRPGYFLCSIGDGEDCKFSIYDDASSIDSRFRSSPEYRKLFKEIFDVLKKAATNKEEGEKLPLLDDANPPITTNKVPPVTPANEELPDFGDDSQSIISSAVSEQSFAMSECITKLERKSAKKHIIEKNQENKPPALAALSASTQLVSSPSVNQIIENGRVLIPIKREPLEYLSVGVGIKKKNRKKNRNFNNDHTDSPILPSPPRVFYSSGKKRRDMRPFPVGGQSTPHRPTHEWNGNSMIIYNRSVASTPNSSLRGRELDMSGLEYRPSTVSQDLHKLKKLDLSYAEVLRRADACKHRGRKQ